jgi:hypothetical protein
VDNEQAFNLNLHSESCPTCSYRLDESNDNCDECSFLRVVVEGLKLFKILCNGGNIAVIPRLAQIILLLVQIVKGE